MENKKEILKQFEEIWKMYPKKQGKKSLVRDFENIKDIVNNKDEIIKVMKSYINLVETQRKGGFDRKYRTGIRFFNNWKDVYDLLDNQEKELLKFGFVREGEKFSIDLNEEQALKVMELLK